VRSGGPWYRRVTTGPVVGVVVVGDEDGAGAVGPPVVLVDVPPAGGVVAVAGHFAVGHQLDHGLVLRHLDPPAGDDWLQALHATLGVEDPDPVLGPTRRPLVGVTAAHGVGVTVHESRNG